MTCLCGHRGFAGPSACVLEKGHEGDHEYGDYQQALAIAAAKELHSLRDQLATVTAERDEYRIKHEVACSTLERVRGHRDAAQNALAAQCKHTKELEAEIKRLTTAPREWREDLHCAIIDLCEQVQEARSERDELLAALNFARQGYQARFESGEAGDVAWAEMYIQSIDAAMAIAKGEK